MDPLTLLSLMSTGIGMAGGLKSLFGGSGGQQNMMQYGGNRTGGPSTYKIPGAGTAVQMPRFTSEQQQALQGLLSQGASGLGNLPSADFAPIRKMYETQFQQETIPQLSEQFTTMAPGSQGSSAFRNALSGAGAGLSERLSGMQQQFNMQNRQSEIARLMQMLGMGLEPQFETGYYPEQQGFLKSLFGGLLPALGSIGGAAAQYGAPIGMRYLENKYPDTFGARKA